MQSVFHLQDSLMKEKLVLQMKKRSLFALETNLNNVFQMFSINYFVFVLIYLFFLSIYLYKLMLVQLTFKRIKWFAIRFLFERFCFAFLLLLLQYCMCIKGNLIAMCFRDFFFFQLKFLNLYLFIFLFIYISIYVCSRV